MKIRALHSVGRRESNTRLLPANALAAAVAAILASSAGAQDAATQDTAKQDTASQDATKQDATKQDATKPDATKPDADYADLLGQITVSGIRHSIETSIATKKASTSIVEVVSAEDIGKLPDTSIADSIARLPGLAAQRIDGRPAAISIRGLGEDYAGALLNGRQVVSSSEGRSAEYDQFPSELVSQVLVYKTVDSAVVGQGLSGTIDIRPLMPLSLNQPQIGVSARVERNTNGGLSSTGQGEYGSRFSASYVDQFRDNTIGVSLGFAHLDSPGQDKKYGAWAFGDYNGQWGSAAPGVPFVGQSGTCLVGDDRPTGPPPDFAFIPEDCAVFQQGFEASVTSSKQVRDGAMAVLQFKPNDRFSSAVDLYYSKFDQDRVGHHWVGEIGLWSGGAAFTNVSTRDVNGNTVIDSGTVDGSKSLVYDKNFDRTDKIRAAGWRNELDFGNEWRGSFDVGYSQADRDELYIQSVAEATAVSSLTFSQASAVDDVSWTTPQALTDPAVIPLSNARDFAEMRDPTFKDRTKSAQLLANRSLDWGGLSGLEVGVAYNQRDKDVRSDAFHLTLTDGSEVMIPASAVRDPVTIDVAGIHQQVLSWDVPSIMGLYTVQLKNPSTASTSKFDVHEKIKTGFTRVDIETDWGVPVHGNLGVQVVRSDQESNGFATTFIDPDHATVEAVNGGATYTDVLPSLNLVFDLPHDLFLRFGLGKSMARPRMDDMRAGADAPRLEANTGSTTQGHWVADGGGKPDLKPWRAKAVDLSVEKYFERRSYVALAGFLKKLDSFIYQKSTVRDFTGFPNDSSLVPGCEATAPDCDPNLGDVSTQANGSGGKVYGLEASASIDGSLFTPKLDGIGLVMSYANTRNSLPDDENGNPIDLDGFSSTVNSFAAYFERGGFSARVSTNYRSAFTATTRSVLLGTLRSTKIDAERSVDAQISYSFDSGVLEGLTVLLQGNNLANERSITRQSPETVGAVGSSTGLLPWVDENFGRTLLLGVSYKL